MEPFATNTFYMLSVDAEVNDLESTAVPAAQLKSILATTKGKLVVLLDACHSGAQEAMLSTAYHRFGGSDGLNRSFPSSV